MSHLDALFGNTDEFGDENDGEIRSDDEIQNADNDDPDANGDDGESKPVKIEPKKKTVRHPRLTLNVALLSGSRGIIDMENYFKDMKFKGKGHEREDLDSVMKRMQHWAHRMFPKYGFDDSLAAIEHLGRKKPMQSYMNKYRMGMLEPEVKPLDENEDEELAYESNVLNQPLDPLDSMLDEQIAISRAGTSFNTSGVANLSLSERNFDSLKDDDYTRASPVPTTSVPTSSGPAPGLSEDMRAKIAANRLKALEIRKAKMAALASPSTATDTIAEVLPEVTENHEN